MTEISKPITVVREDFITELTNLVNSCGLPPFIIEPILKDMLANVKVAAKRQLDADLARYAEMLNSAQTTE